MMDSYATHAVREIRQMLIGTEKMLQPNLCAYLLDALQKILHVVENNQLFLSGHVRLFNYIVSLSYWVKRFVEGNRSKGWTGWGLLSSLGEYHYGHVIEKFMDVHDALSNSGIDVQDIISIQAVPEKIWEEDRKILIERIEKYKNEYNLIGLHKLARFSLESERVDYLMQRLHWIDSKCNGGGTGGISKAHPVSDLFNLDPNSVKSAGSCRKGTSSSVTKGRFLGVPCAIKTFRTEIQDFRSSKSFFERENSFKEELSTMAMFNHPNIVKCFGHGRKRKKNSSERFLVMERMENNLSEKIHGKSGKRVRFTYYGAIDVMLRVANASRYLHSCGIEHLDLKPDNVLVNSWKLDESDAGGFKNVKLADFGLSRLGSDPSESKKNGGTTLYRAPEMNPCNDHPTVAFKADVFSFGVMFAEILSGKCPFEGVPRYELQNRLEEGLRPDLPNNFDDLASLVSECWDSDAGKRPGFDEIYGKLRELKIQMLQGLHPEMPTFDTPDLQTDMFD